MPEMILMIVLFSVLVMNVYTLKISIDNLIVSEELVENATMRQTRILELKTASLTDYAWHFNTGQKLDMLQDDIDKIKNELRLVDNFTYAGPHQDEPVLTPK